MTRAGILYTAEMDLPDADVAAFLSWYGFRHAADLYQAGFQVCTCYRAIEGDMNILDLYQAASAEVFTTPRYRAMMANDPYAGGLMVKRRNKAHTVYEQHLVTPGDANGEAPPLDADWISLIRFAASEPVEAELAKLLAEDESAGPVGAGAKRVRLAHRTTDHPTNPTFRPRCMLVIEWAERPPAQVRPAHFLRDRFSDDICEVDSFVGYRVYPWPNRSGPG